ncbi:hypothetical protein, partial [Streptomyces sp. NPDC058728]|uniref:hypothetical protein n=1 Tax=Streptomyces sp. NPDC058728 TaxID=3346612 RepID=UPI0036B24B5A
MNCRDGGHAAPKVTVHPPDHQGRRRVHCDGQDLGRALNPGDVLEFRRRAGLDPDSVRLDGPLSTGAAADPRSGTRDRP